MKRKKFSKKIMAIVLIGCIIFAIFFYYIDIAHPIIRNYSRAKINERTERILNTAVSNVINTTLNYDSIVNISYNSQGDIAYINANQYSVNTITREIVKNAQNLMQELSTEGIKIPLGTFSGISLFSGRGPNVRLQALTVAIVSSEFKSKFTTIGINNALHQLYLDVVTKVELVLPLKNTIISTKQSVLLCEGIIIGKVPEFYFKGENLDNNLDLVP